MNAFYFRVLFQFFHFLIFSLSLFSIRFNYYDSVAFQRWYIVCLGYLGIGQRNRGIKFRRKKWKKKKKKTKQNLTITRLDSRSLNAPPNHETRELRDNRTEIFEQNANNCWTINNGNSHWIYLGSSPKNEYCMRNNGGKNIIISVFIRFWFDGRFWSKMGFWFDGHVTRTWSVFENVLIISKSWLRCFSLSLSLSIECIYLHLDCHLTGYLFM